MPAQWIHRKVWLAWNRWGAVQFARQWDELSCGVRLNWKRPLLDLYLGPLTLAVGKHAVYSDPRTRTNDSCRGMLFPDDHRWPLNEADAVKARIL